MRRSRIPKRPADTAAYRVAHNYLKQSGTQAVSAHRRNRPYMRSKTRDQRKSPRQISKIVRFCLISTFQSAASSKVPFYSLIHDSASKASLAPLAHVMLLPYAFLSLLQLGKRDTPAVCDSTAPFATLNDCQNALTSVIDAGSALHPVRVLQNVAVYRVNGMFCSSNLALCFFFGRKVVRY